MVVIDGVVYFPTPNLYVGCNGDLNVTSKLFAMVANRFYLQSNGTLYLSNVRKRRGVRVMTGG